jgi:hypothetical protein
MMMATIMIQLTTLIVTQLLRYSLPFMEFEGPLGSTVFETARCWAVSEVRLIQFTHLHQISLRPIVIFSHLCLGLPSRLTFT